jgi:hypothetical protein
MVSGGNHIQRENLAPTVLGRIATDNDLIRFYLARLLRGTIVEEPGQRWTASRFLEEVRTTRKLLDRVKEYEDRGLIVLTDGFGAGDSFGETSFALATAKDPNYPTADPQGGSPGARNDQDVGAAFKVLADRDVRLETIALGLAHMAGEDELDVWVVTDLNGKPDVDGELEVFRVSGDGSYSSRVEHIRSQERPVLRRGHRYWILLSVPVPHSAIALWSAPLDFVPRPALYAERLNGGEWDVRKSPSGPGHAIRVTGRPVEQR